MGRNGSGLEILDNDAHRFTGRPTYLFFSMFVACFACFLNPRVARSLRQHLVLAVVSHTETCPSCVDYSTPWCVSFGGRYRVAMRLLFSQYTHNIHLLCI